MILEREDLGRGKPSILDGGRWQPGGQRQCRHAPDVLIFEAAGKYEQSYALEEEISFSGIADGKDLNLSCIVLFKEGARGGTGHRKIIRKEDNQWPVITAEEHARHVLRSLLFPISFFFLPFFCSLLFRWFVGSHRRGLLTRNTRAPHFTPQHWLLCHMGLY